MPKLVARPFQAKTIQPYWTTADKTTVKLYQGDVVDVLQRLPAQSVHCVVTSPPYWGLRDYSVCSCRVHVQDGHSGKSLTSSSGSIAYKPEADPNCTSCGGSGKVKGMENQIGSEPSPDCGTQGQAQCGRCFVCKMVQVFREVRRVLRDDGVLWLNLGDSYNANTGKGFNTWEYRDAVNERYQEIAQHHSVKPSPSGLKPGNLVGIPWRVALALQADGWMLRQDIVWAKPSPMPESVQNRCTKAHEYIFLLTKSMRYFYDAEAVKERGKELPPEPDWEEVRADATREAQSGGTWQHGVHNHPGQSSPPNGRNKRDVWIVSSQGYEGAHFATFPPKLIEPCILAGTSEHGCCGQCGAPWRRIVEKQKLKRERPNDYVKRTGEEGTGNSCANSVAGVDVRTIGWEPTCTCENRAEVKPCIVLDPFIGSGTTCCVALEHGRYSVGIDLSEKYLKENAIPRIEGELLARPALVWLAGREPSGAVFGSEI